MASELSRSQFSSKNVLSIFGWKTHKPANLEGHSGMHKDQLRLYYEIVQYDFVRTVCETGRPVQVLFNLFLLSLEKVYLSEFYQNALVSISGFNAGHSAFMWLNSNPHLHLYSFDLGEHSYSWVMADQLQLLFPGRLNVTFGDSTKTLVEFHKKNPHILCDLVVIDGGHLGNVPQKDFENFAKMVDVTGDHLLIFDDWPSEHGAVALDLQRMWRNVTESHRAKTLRQCMNYGSAKGVTIGLFVYWSLSMLSRFSKWLVDPWSPKLSGQMLRVEARARYTCTALSPKATPVRVLNGEGREENNDRPKVTRNLSVWTMCVVLKMLKHFAKS